MPDADPQEIQALQFYLNEYGQQAEVFSRQLELLEQRRLESLAAIESLQALKADREAVVLVPLGGGTVTRARVLDPDRVLVNIGADVTIQRTGDEAVAFLRDRVTELEAMEKKLAGTIDQLRGQINEIARRIEAAYGQAKAAPAAK